MKRLAWLLLALSLPAWATINGLDSSRVVLPSFDGTRYGMYVAGDLPATPPEMLYTNSFDGNPTNTKDNGCGNTHDNIGIFADQSDIDYDPSSISECRADGPDVFIVADPDDSENSVLKFVNNASSGETNTEDSGIEKHRVKIRFAMHLSNDVQDGDPSDDHMAGGDGFRLLPGTEYWVGFRYRYKVTGTLPTSQQIFFEPSTSNVGEPLMYLDKRADRLVTRNWRYKDTSGTVHESAQESLTGLTPDTWVCYVHRIKRAPYTWGSAYDDFYAAGAPGSNDPTEGKWTIYAGQYSAGSAAATKWAAGSLDEDDATYGGWIGTDREAQGTYNPTVRIGLYWGYNSNEASEAVLYLDDLKIAESSGTLVDDFAAVAPPGCTLP